jgi:hypothetical protein
MKNLGEILYAGPPLAKQMFASGFNVGILAGTAILVALRFCVMSPGILR